MLFNNRSGEELNSSSFTELGRLAYKTAFFPAPALAVSARDGVEELCQQLYRIDPRPSNTHAFGNRG